MKHLSKSASLFGIGAFVLFLAVLSAVAGSGTASADGPAGAQGTAAPPISGPEHQCTYQEAKERLIKVRERNDSPRVGFHDGWLGSWYTVYRQELWQWFVVETCIAPGRTIARNYWDEERWDPEYVYGRTFIREGQ